MTYPYVLWVRRGLTWKKVASTREQWQAKDVFESKFANDYEEYAITTEIETIEFPDKSFYSISDAWNNTIKIVQSKKDLREAFIEATNLWNSVDGTGPLKITRTETYSVVLSEKETIRGVSTKFHAHNAEP